MYTQNNIIILNVWGGKKQKLNIYINISNEYDDEYIRNVVICGVVLLNVVVVLVVVVMICNVNLNELKSISGVYTYMYVYVYIICIYICKKGTITIIFNTTIC